SGDGDAEISRWVAYGASPRGGQALLLGAKVHALLDGRPHVSYEDVDRVARAALRHRLVLTFTAETEGIEPATVVARVLAAAARQGGGPGADRRVRPRPAGAPSARDSPSPSADEWARARESAGFPAARTPPGSSSRRTRRTRRATTCATWTGTCSAGSTPSSCGASPPSARSSCICWWTRPHR